MRLLSLSLFSFTLMGLSLSAWGQQDDITGLERVVAIVDEDVILQSELNKELAEAKRLREEAQHLLAEYQRKRKEAEAEAAGIVAAAEREAAALTEEARQKTEEFVARRTALSEQKIKQAEEDAIGAVRSAAVDGVHWQLRARTSTRPADQPAGGRRFLIARRTDRNKRTARPRTPSLRPSHLPRATP